MPYTSGMSIIRSVGNAVGEAIAVVLDTLIVLGCMV